MTEATQTEAPRTRRRTAKKKVAKKVTKKKATAKKDPLAAAQAAAKKRNAAKTTEQKEADAKIEAAKKAAKEAADAQKAAEKAEERAKKEAAEAKARAATEKALVTTAKNINGRIDVIERSQKKTDDHRLALAIELAVAKEQCREGHIKYKEWCEANIKQAYETHRKLLPIGEAEREKGGAGAKMLKDLRTGAAQRNAKLRAKKKAEKDAKDGTDEQPKASKKKDPEKARAALDDLDKDDWREVMEAQAKVGGLRLISEEDVDDEVAHDEGKLRKETGIQEMQRLFGKLKANDKMAFATWAAEEVGMDLVEAEEDDTDADED